MKKIILAALLTGLTFPVLATQFYVVVPVLGRGAPVGNVQVVLNAVALPGAVVGRVYSGFDFNTVLQVRGDASFTPGRVRWNVVTGALPTGLELGLDGKLSGTPLVAGASSFQLQATYRGVGASLIYPLHVQTAVPDLRVEGTTTEYNFGNIPLGSDSTKHTVTVRNSGTAAGALEMGAFTGAHPADFSATSTCASVAPDASCNVHVMFKPSTAGIRTASLSVAGTSLAFTGTGQAASRQYVVLLSGSAYKIPYGINTVTAWVVGGGGGGGGAPTSSWTTGGSGGAGGLSYTTFNVTPGGTLNYTVGRGGAGGYGVTGALGGTGGTTTLTYQAVLLRAEGGTGGSYTTSPNGHGSGKGGAASGGVNHTGGDGRASSGGYGTPGATSGGAIGGVAGNWSNGYSGSAGAIAEYPGGLEQAIIRAGQPLGAPGEGAPYRSTAGGNDGGWGYGFGHGGGSAASGGGTGGRGAYGGGGGGAAPDYWSEPYSGGQGGDGFIVLQLN